MKAESTIRRQLRQVERELKDAPDGLDKDALYGAMTALSWALGQDTMAPAKAFTYGRKWTFSASASERSEE